MSGPLDRILSIRQAAEMMDVSNNAIYLRIRRETMLQAKPGGWPIKVKLEEVVRVLDGVPVNGHVPHGIAVDPASPLSRLLTYHETMEYMGIANSTLSNRIGHGKRPRPIRCAAGCIGKWMFRLADVVDAMDNPNARTPEEREMSALRTAQKRKEPKYEIKYETIRAQCPTCHMKFNAKVVVGSSKWIYCKLHARNRYAENRAFATDYNLNYL